MAAKKSKKKKPVEKIKTKLRNADGLSPKQAEFVKQYLIDKNGVRSAMAAGYGKSYNAANVYANHLLQNPNVNKAIMKVLDANLLKLSKKVERVGITKERWLKELALIGFAEMKQFARVTKRGVELTKTDKLEDGLTGAIKALKQSVSAQGGSQSLELHSKLPALQMIADHFGWTKQRVEHSGDPEGVPIKFQGMTDEQLLARVQELAGLLKKPESSNES